MADNGDPDPEAFRIEHEQYCRALTQAGLTVTRLPPLDDYPDSVFVEDPALVLPEAAILFRSGAPSRAGEGVHLAAVLEDFRPLVRLDLEDGPEGFVDGGDILVTGREIIVGLSARTDRAGSAKLNALLSGWGYACRCVVPPDGLLHLKTGCSLLDDDTVLATPSLAASDIFSDYRIVEVPAGEDAGANSIRLNDHLIVAEGFPLLAGKLADLGFHVVELPVRQAACLDGGLSCMSLRF